MPGSLPRRRWPAASRGSSDPRHPASGRRTPPPRGRPGATSPTSAVSRPGDAHVEHGSTGLHEIGGDQVGHSGCGDDDVGTPDVGREVPRPGVAQRDGRVLRLAGEQQAERPTDGHAAADDAHLARRRSARRSGAAARRSRAACTAAAPGDPSTSRPRFTGCRPSASLAGSMRLEHGVGVQALRQRQLDDVAGARRVGVELADRVEDLGLR